MRKQLVLLLLGLVLISFVSAEINNYAPVKSGECALLSQVCSSCTYVNISIMYPNLTIADNNMGMADRGGGLWTYEFCNTNDYGRYDVSGEGDISGTATGFDILYFEVTATGGLGNTTTIFIIFILCSTGLLLISFLFKNYIFAVISGFSFLLTGVYTMINGFSFITSANTQMLSIIIIGLGAIISITSGLELANTSYNQKGDEFY